MELNFHNAENLLSFLTTSRYGKTPLREALFGEQADRVVNERPDQHRASNGYVEVYGEKDVYAKIVLLGRSVTFPEHEVLLEKAVDGTLSPGHRSVHFPGMKRASAFPGVP
mgnify:CR=1 FL=1